MIRAEHAARIMQRYEDDYDNFLDKLKAKRNAKKQQASQARAVAERADVSVRKAEARKPAVLKERAKNLLDKAGGIEGAVDTAKNVMKYFKTDTAASSDYQMGFGGEGAATPEKKILGMSPIVVYAGGAVLALACLYGISRMVKNSGPATTRQSITPPSSQVLPLA